jgi:hypothetical protein
VPVGASSACTRESRLTLTAPVALCPARTSAVAVVLSVAVFAVTTGRPLLSTVVVTTRTGWVVETFAGSSCAGLTVRPYVVGCQVGAATGAAAEAAPAPAPAKPRADAPATAPTASAPIA